MNLTVMPFYTQAVSRIIRIMLKPIVSLLVLVAITARVASGADSESTTDSGPLPCQTIPKPARDILQPASNIGNSLRTMVYHGVDKSRGGYYDAYTNNDYHTNVTAYVQLVEDSSKSTGRGGYWIINSSFNSTCSIMSAFAGYTSNDRATLLFHSYYLDIPSGESRTAFINTTTGCYINYTEYQLDNYKSGGDAITAYFYNGSATIYCSDTATNCNSDPQWCISEVSQSADPNIMNSSHALNTTSNGFFDLRPTGPHPLLATGHPVPLRNENGELLSKLDVAASGSPPPPLPAAGKGDGPVFSDATCLSRIMMLTLIVVTLMGRVG